MKAFLEKVDHRMRSDQRLFEKAVLALRHALAVQPNGQAVLANRGSDKDRQALSILRELEARLEEEVSLAVS